MKAEKIYRLASAIAIPFHVIYVVWMGLGLIFIDTPSLADLIGFVLIPSIMWVIVYIINANDKEVKKEENKKLFKQYILQTSMVYLIIGGVFVTMLY